MKIYHLFIQKQSFILFQLLFIIILLTGCWSAKEIHDIAFINDIGVDLNDAGEFEVTAVIVKPMTLFPINNNEEGEKGQNQYLIETTTGKTVFEAVSKLSKAIPEKIYFGHMNVAVFGEKLARERMETALDFFTRDNEFRPTIQVLVTKGKASEIITTSPQLNKTIGLEILSLVNSNSNKYSPTAMVKDLSKFMKDLTSDTSDPITGVLTTTEKEDIKTKGADQVSPEAQKSSPKAVSLDGTAVFKGGKLKGYLDNKETRELLLINGKLKNEAIVLNYGKNQNDHVSVLITENKSELIPQLNGKSKKMRINATVEAAIQDATSSSIQLNSEDLELLNDQLEQLMKEEATALLNKVQKGWQADIFGFGDSINRRYPAKWDQIAQDWRSGGLKDLSVDLHIKANISRYGLHKDPSHSYESR